MRGRCSERDSEADEEPLAIELARDAWRLS